MMRKFKLLALSLVLGLAGAPTAAHAFCGFYVSGASGDLYNEATKVVLMRNGRTTVLSMQNAYQGPPEDFAMVVPVPTVLHEENVKTLTRGVFDRIDQLAAPRLVEYWEQNPCPRRDRRRPTSMSSRRSGQLDDLLNASLGGGSPHRVTVEAQFAVGEYDIQILSAQDSSGLEAWLREQRYNIPQGAGDVLRPYVERGTKFFVAKVDAGRVTFSNGRAILSPLRFSYETDEFSLPVRLGLLNSNGKQDLIAHVIAPNQRYEAANYPNATIPTNIRVRNRVRRSFGRFYAALFDKTLERHRGAVITEYSWQATNCDPCPVSPLSASELSTLGNDVLRMPAHQMVLTRLHYRYDAQSLGDDLVFRPADPIVGGRGMPDRRGRMTEQPGRSRANQFQGRYVMLNRWRGAIECANPRRGVWGGPPAGTRARTSSATNTAFIRRRSAPLERWIRDDVPEIGLRRHRPSPPSTPAPKTASAQIDDLGGASAALLGSFLGLALYRRRRR